ncbi:MAG: hypothetical protein WB587_05780 [Nitrososphaeraceae archaeon]
MFFDEIEAEVTVQYTQKDYYQVIDLLDILIAAQSTNPGDRLVRSPDVTEIRF